MREKYVLMICVCAEDFLNLTCEKRVFTYMGCVDDSQENTICAGYDGKQEIRGCDYKWPWGNRGDYMNCWNDESVVTECSEEPECDDDWTEVARRTCSIYVEECEDTCSPARDVYSCSADNKILVNTCEDTNDDGCLEWDGIKGYYDCGTGKECVEGSNVCVDKTAVLEASYVIGGDGDIGTTTRYFYDVTLTESNGVAVTINSGKRCYSYTGNCYDFTPSFIIPAGGSITRANQYFQTSYHPDVATYTYSGTNSESVSFSISTQEY